MISSKGFTAVVHCDNCSKELSQGPYPADAEDNLPPDSVIVSGDDEKNNKHYCATCKRLVEEEEIEEMDAVLRVCRQLIEAKKITTAVKYYRSKMKCSEQEAIDTVGTESIFYKSVKELQK